jgi:hypothetical protein
MDKFPEVLKTTSKEIVQTRSYSKLFCYGQISRIFGDYFEGDCANQELQ